MGCFFSENKYVDDITVDICYMSPFMIVTILIMWRLLQCGSEKSEEERFHVGYQRKNCYLRNSSDVVISVGDSGASTQEY